jgi:hypothetical protein
MQRFLRGTQSIPVSAVSVIELHAKPRWRGTFLWTAQTIANVRVEEAPYVHWTLVNVRKRTLSH